MTIEYDCLLQSIYRSDSLLAVAYALANDGRQWLQVDRLSVLEVDRGRARVLAVSGVDVIDRRAEPCRGLEALATFVASSDEEFFYPTGHSGEEAEQPDHGIRRYLQDSHARQLLARPLRRKADQEPAGGDETVGVLVLEQFTRQTALNDLRQRLDALQPHAAIALGNAIRQQRLPLARLGRRIQTWQRLAPDRRAAWICGLTLLAVAMLGLLVVPVEFRVRATGQLQPEERRDVFAIEDGVIDQLWVDHGSQVQAGQPLVELSQSELEYAASQLDGQLRTTQQQQQALVARRWDAPRADAAAGEDELRLAAEQELLQQTLEGLTRQRQILQQRQEQLRLSSPLAGEVVTWNVQQQLLKRPVRKGQRLLSIVNRQGPWIAELQVPDRDIQHVLRAQQSGVPLSVSIRLSTDPDQLMEGQIAEVARVTSAGDKPTVRVVAKVDSQELSARRPGASVVGQIPCGRRPLAYLWLHDLWDWLRLQGWWT